MAEACKLESSVPKFEKGRIVKTQAMEELREFPRTLAKISLAGHTDGIVEGFLLSGEQAGQVRVSPGALRHKGELLLVHAPHFLPVGEYGVRLQAKLAVTGYRETEDFKTFLLKLTLAPFQETGQDEYELARFLLEEGAVLRGIPDYGELGDFATEYNTVCCLHVPYSGARLPDVPQGLLRFFAHTLLGRDILEEIDRIFCLQALGGPLDREAVLYYLSLKIRAPYRDYSNEEIYRHFQKICFTAQKEHAPVKPAAASRRASII